MNKLRTLFTLASAAFLIGSTSTAFAGTSCSALADNLVVNCGFETGDFSGWTEHDPSNYTGVDSHNPNSGTYAGSLGAVGSAGTLSQTFTDVAGAYYGFSFSLENEVALDATGTPYPGTNTFSASYTNDLGNTYVLISAKNIAESTSYSNYEVYFFGTGQDTILFTFLNGPSYFDLDDISVIDPEAPGPDPNPTENIGNSPVPEPSSLVLMGTGILSLAGVARRKFQGTSTQSAS